MTFVRGGFNWSQMLLHNNNCFYAAYEEGGEAGRGEGLAFGHSEEISVSSPHVSARGFMVETTSKKSSLAGFYLCPESRAQAFQESTGGSGA